MLVLKQPIALLLLAILLSGCAREKDLLDEQVRKLCAVDGGIKVHEKISLAAGRFDEFGEIRVPPKELSKSSDEFFYEWDMIHYKSGNPEMWRSYFRLLRRSDNKLLGEAIVYTRRGGDMPGPWHDSSYSCPERSDIKYLKLAVFVKDSSGK